MTFYGNNILNIIGIISTHYTDANIENTNGIVLKKLLNETKIIWECYENGFEKMLFIIIAVYFVMCGNV